MTIIYNIYILQLIKCEWQLISKPLALHVKSKYARYLNVRKGNHIKNTIFKY